MVHSSSRKSQTSRGSRKHAAEKKVSRKKQLQCRNRGCQVFFTREDSRIRHESYSCSSSSASGVSEIQSTRLECSFPGCGNTYSQECSLKRHEQDAHNYYEKRGRTISASSLKLPAPSPSFLPRPQSCPPNVTEFLTPDRPSKRRRFISSSSTSSLASSPDSSLFSPDTPLASPIISPFESPILSPITSPNATLTVIATDSSTSEAEADAAPHPEREKNKCCSCLLTFSKRKYLRQHQ